MPIEDNTIDRWGGRKRRYDGFPGRRLGIVDPISSLPVAFRTTLVRDNWHVARFDHDVVHLSCTVKELIFQLGARRLVAFADLDLSRRCGARELHLVCRHKPPAERYRALRAVAKYLNAEVIVRTEAAIDPASILISNLRLLRQRMQLWSGRGAELDPQVIALLDQSPATTVREIAAACAGMHPQQVDSRLGHLHCTGRLTLQLSKVTYGQLTTVTRGA